MVEEMGRGLHRKDKRINQHLWFACDVLSFPCLPVYSIGQLFLKWASWSTRGLRSMTDTSEKLFSASIKMYPYIVCITCTNKNSDMFVTHHLHLSWDHPFFLRGQRTVAAVAAYAAMRLTSTLKYSTQSTLRAQTSDTEIYMQGFLEHSKTKMYDLLEKQSCDDSHGVQLT